jgi:DNA sulfur modification protein DndD
MKLKELIITNFMPYKGQQTVVFPQDEVANVMLLFGDNMRGKTSFLNAIRWGFYGKAVGRHLQSIPRHHLVNIEAATEGDWSMSIVLKFSDSGKEYELRRQIKKKNHVSQPKNDADFEQVIRLKVDGKPVSHDTVENEINQISPEEISRFFLFDGELLQEYENLLVDDSEQGEKIKEHIEQALGVPALIHGRDEFALLLKDARRVQAKDAKKNTELKRFAEQHNQLEIQLTSIEKDLADLVVQRSTIQKQVDDIDDELKNTEAVQRKKIELEGLASERKAAEQQLESLANEQRELLKKAYLDVLHSNMAPLLDTIKTRRDSLQSVTEKKAVLNSQISTLQKSIDDPTCATCKQAIPDEKIDPIREKIAMLRAEEELSIVNPEEIRALNIKIDKLATIRSASEGSRLIENDQKQRSLQVQLIRVESQEDELEVEIREFDTEQIMRQRDKRDKWVGQLSRLNGDIDKCKSDRDKNISEQDHIATLISKSAGGQGQKSSIRVNMYQDLEAIFSAGIDQLRDALRGDVEGHATKAFAELTTEKTYSGLQINQNYGLSIIDQEGRILKQRSAGAEQIVALSLIDGLNRTARKAGPIVMDTPLGRLDPKHRSNVLKYLPKMADQVVLLVHEGEIDPDRDIQNFAERIGARYQIERISATESRIVKSN